MAVAAAAAGLIQAAQAPAAYSLYMADGRRSLPFRAAGSTDYVSLDQLAGLFNLTLTEDTLAGGLTVRSRGQTILLIPGQSFARVGADHIVSLPAVVQRDRGSWQVPIEFLPQALGPALGTRIDVRRPSHVVLVGDVRLPQVALRIERDGRGGRIVVEDQPPAPHRVTRDGNRLTVHFDAAGVDLAPVAGASPDFVTGAHADGASVVVDLGPPALALTYRSEDTDATHFTIDLPPPGAPPEAARGQAPPPPTPAPPPPPPVLDTGSSGTIRTIAIDAGHGGDDEGVRGQSLKEKDYALQMARRLKTAIEGQIGVRVLLTRDTDENVPLDRRAALANNNKADLLISLHLDAAAVPSVHGVQVLSADINDYVGRVSAASLRGTPLPIVGGGTRTIDIVPWDLAQIPFAAKSASVAAVLVRHLSERNVPLFDHSVARMPLRLLVGANMPAVMIEMGFLTNPDDEQALAGPERPGSLVDAIVATVDEVRRGIPTAPDARP